MLTLHIFSHSQFSQDFGLNATLQRWVIGKRLVGDGETLYSHGIRKSGDQAFLFIRSDHAGAPLTRHLQQREEEQQRLDSGFPSNPYDIIRCAY